MPLASKRCRDPQRNPEEVPEGGSYLDNLNPHSLEVIRNGFIEPAAKNAIAGNAFQFERTGYFCADPIDSAADAPVFNRIVTLKDTWAKIEKTVSSKHA